MLMSRAGPIALPLAAMGGLLYVLNNKESSEKLAAETRGTQSLGKATKDAMEKGFGITGTTGADLIMGKGELNYRGDNIGDKVYTYKGVPTALNLSDYFTSNAGNLGSNIIDAGTVKVNSENINTYQNSAIAIGGSGAFDIRDNLGKQIQGFGT